jgi:plastocyanin
MRRAALLAPLAGLALALAAPSAGAMDHDMTMGPGGAPAAGAAAQPGVSILFSAFNAPRLDIVTGDTVRWSNDSARAHDVVSSDDGFDSGRLPVGGTYAHRFDAPGTMTYYCSIHPFMTGEIDVHPVVLEAPTQHAGSGKPFVLSGRVAAGTTGSVAIEGDSGGGFLPAGTAVVGADGTFRTTVVPRATTSYRATIDGQDSPAVPLLVLDHHVSVGTMDHGRHTMVTVRVAPAAAGQTVVLQLRLPERFGWWPVAQARLGRDSTATFDVPRRGRVPARVLLTQPDGATELARSRTVHVGPVVRRR